jgi:hypothetical protein
MDLDCAVSETVAPEVFNLVEVGANIWLPNSALAVYIEEHRRNGFQAKLQWYRVTTTGIYAGE